MACYLYTEQIIIIIIIVMNIQIETINNKYIQVMRCGISEEI